MQEDRWSVLLPCTWLESKLNYYPVSELMIQISGFSKLIATLIAPPYFKAQKPITYLNISVMVFCVRRNGWFSVYHTHNSVHIFEVHMPCPSDTLTRSSLFTLTYIYVYATHKIIYVCPKFYRTFPCFFFFLPFFAIARHKWWLLWRASSHYPSRCTHY